MNLPRVDETYIKVKGEWKYLYRAVNAEGRTIDFYLSSTRTISAATIFLKKALRAARHYAPHTITTDQNPTYGVAIEQINAERKEDPPLRHVSGVLPPPCHDRGLCADGWAWMASTRRSSRMVR